MNDEHKINLEIKKKKDNYYILEDKHEHISPEQGIIILDKYTTTSKMDRVKKEINDLIDNKIQSMGLIKKPKNKDEPIYRG